jgi:hypothetical protein
MFKIHLDEREKGHIKRRAILESDNQDEFNIVRSEFRVYNPASKFSKWSPPFNYYLSSSGLFEIGLTEDVITICKNKYGYEIEIDEDVKKIIKPSYNYELSKNLNLNLRDYQEECCKTMLNERKRFGYCWYRRR